MKRWNASQGRITMAETEFPMVDVLKLKPLGERKLWLRFTDGCEGVYDLSDFVESGGPMVEPLREDGYFARVFVEMGVPTWPNGLDLDPINLYMEMKKSGQLRRVDAA
jgi:hypothetical protein